MNVDLSTFKNSWYNPGSIFKRMLWYWVNIIFFKSSIFPFYGLKVLLLKMFGATVGKGVLIKPNVNIKYPWFLSIGNHVWIGEQVWIDNLAQITIGNNVCISQGALLICGNHDYSKTNFDLIVKPIVLEDSVWIGAKAIVFGGAICKSHSVFSAASHVSGIFESYSIYTGNPAVKIKTRIIL
jgi:putative colanic acid biosynthesis acetyltransferase WcaF